MRAITAKFRLSILIGLRRRNLTKLVLLRKELRKNLKSCNLKELEKENAQLKKAVAELTLDKLILKEAAEGNF